MGEKKFVKLLGTSGQDRLRFEVKAARGKVVDIVVQYEALINERWRAIVRYDCRHGFTHRDVLHQHKRPDKSALRFNNLGDFLAYAEQDLKDRWQWYRKQYEEKR